MTDVKQNSTGRRPRILVVDDEELLLLCIKRLISSEYDVVTVAVAKEALGLIADGEIFDVIVTDLTMPGMDGIEFFAELKKTAPAFARRVVFMSGGATTPEQYSFLTSNGHFCLDKPFNPQELKEKISEVLERDRASIPFQ